MANNNTRRHQWTTSLLTLLATACRTHEAEATGDTILGLAERDFVAGHFTGELPPPGQGASEIAVVFAREEVRPAYERALAAGAQAVVEPREESWKQLVSYVRDPDGHLLEICSPVG